MLAAALHDPDPVMIFEHAMLYPLEGEIDESAAGEGAFCREVRRTGKDTTIITYGGSLGKVLQAADRLAAEQIEAEVIDLARAPARCSDHPRVDIKNASSRDRR